MAEGEDLVTAAWPAEFVLVAPGSGIEGIEVEPDLLARVSAHGQGARAIGVYERVGFRRGEVYTHETNGGEYEFLSMWREA